MDKTSNKGKITLSLIALAFFGPMALAVWMYYSGQDVELGANNGALILPTTNLHDAVPGSATLDTEERQWLIVYRDDEDCDEDCQNALYIHRQSHKMLGREMDRVGRIYLHGDAAPDANYLESEHADMITRSDPALSAYLASRRPAGLKDGGYYLIDPNGNLVLYFDPTMNPKAMVADIKRLLKTSQIG